jgi:uncharacterized protein (TIGR03067 family)
MTSLLLAVPLVLAAPIPKDFQRPTLEGTWVFVSATSSGRPDALYDGAKWVLEKDGKATRHVGGDAGSAAGYKADPKAKTFDWTVSGTTWTGIYELKGDTLKVALGLESRPTEFAGPSVYVFTMKKAK